MITLSAAARQALTAHLGRQMNRGTFRLLTGERTTLVEVPLKVPPPRDSALTLSTAKATILVSGAPHTFQCLSPSGVVIVDGAIEDLQIDRPFVEAGDDFALTTASLTLF